MKHNIDNYKVCRKSVEIDKLEKHQPHEEDTLSYVRSLTGGKTTVVSFVSENCENIKVSTNKETYFLRYKDLKNMMELLQPSETELAIVGD